MLEARAAAPDRRSTASKEKTMVRHMLEERAQYPSLLVERQPATTTAAPTPPSLVPPKHAATTGATATAGANLQH